MMKLVEIENEGLRGLIGEVVTVWCCRYIYSGKLVGVNDHDIRLDDAVLVFETGAFDAAQFSDAQPLPVGTHYIRTAAIESYCKRSK